MEAEHPSTVIMCIDYRFHDQALKLIEDKYGLIDLIAMAGASKNLASPNHPDDKHALLENIKTSTTLHHSTRIILTSHLDCGAYGGSKSFLSLKDEADFHKKELQKAKQIIENTFPQLEVLTIFLNKNQDDRVFLDIY